MAMLSIREMTLSSLKFWGLKYIMNREDLLSLSLEFKGAPPWTCQDRSIPLERVLPAFLRVP